MIAVEVCEPSKQFAIYRQYFQSLSAAENISLCEEYWVSGCMFDYL